MAYHVGYDIACHHVNGRRHNSMAPLLIFSKCPEMLKYRNREIRKTIFQDCRMHFLPTTYLEMAVH